MDNSESSQLQVLASDLYIIHEKIIKTDELIKIVKDKSKRCNKIEKLHKKLLETHNQLQLKQSNFEIQINNCVLNHTPLVTEVLELRTRIANAEALHSDYVNSAELKYQNVCQELENVKKTQIESPPKTKEKRIKKNMRGSTKEELISKLDDLTIELELTKSELENLNQDLTEKDKIINKYEYEKKLLNEQIASLNNKLNKKEAVKYVNKNTVGVQTDNIIVNEIPLIENDFVMDVLPGISELDNTLPILSDSICAEIVKSNEKQFTSSYAQTNNIEQSFKSSSVQTDFLNETKMFNSFACQTNIATNCVELQTDDDLWLKYFENLRRDKLKTTSSQTYYDDIINLEEVLLEMTVSNPIISPLSPTLVDDCINEEDLNLNKTNSIAVGPDEIIPTFIDLYCQTDRNEKVHSYSQTVTSNELFENNKTPKMIDFNCQTNKIQLIESNTQTVSHKKVDSTCQTEHENKETFNLKQFSLSANIKTPQRLWETKLKNRLNTPNSKICKKYKTTKNKLLEHLKLSNLDFKQILEKYLSEGNGPTLFVSPKILKSSQLNMFNPCKHQNPFINISNRPLFKQCHAKPFNLHECQCFHPCNLQRTYPSCTTLQCNISCNACPGYCNHSHRIKIKHNSNAVIVSSDSEAEEYNIRNYYKNKFRNKYKAKRNCTCNELSKEIFYNRLNSLKREAKTSDTDASSIDACKLRKRRRRLNVSSSDSDDSPSENISISKDKQKRRKFKNPINQIAQETLNNNLLVTTEKRIVKETLMLDSSQNNSNIIPMEKRIETEESITNDNCDNKCNNTILNRNEKDKNIVKSVKEKTTKIQRLRKLLNKTPLNYNKSNVLTRSMSKNIQVDSSKKENTSKQKLDLFGSLSESNSNSDVDENINTSINIQTRRNCNKTKKELSVNVTPEKNQFKNKNLENLVTPTNHVYKRPERRQIVPIGPLSPEPVTCEILQPKIIPLEQISEEKNCIDTISAPEEHVQKPSVSNISSTVFSSKTNKQNNNKVQSQEKRFATKMISDIATMDWDKNLMNTVVASLVNQDTLVIAKLIINEAAIDRDQQLDKTFTPPAPLLAPSQQKLLVLINRLDSEGLSGLKKKVIILAEKRILSEKYLTNILGLTRVYVALCKLQYDIEGVRTFCCNAAYYLGDLFLPIMFIVLTMWGDVLPMASADVPLAVTLVQVIQSKTCNTPGYNSNTLNRLLSDYYEYKRGEITNDQVMDKLVTCFIENPCNSIFTSILILCKNLPSKWRFSQIKKHFLPLVDKHRVDGSKSKLISMTLTLINRLKDMFMSTNDKEYINELNVWLVKLFANTNTNNSINTSF